jgi:hypothetical protein
VENIFLKTGEKKALSVNYFANLRVECHFLKLEYSEFSFLKRRGCQCNLPFSIFESAIIPQTREERKCHTMIFSFLFLKG